jgi:hypothetical protein
MHVGNFVYHVRSKSYVTLLQKIGTFDVHDGSTDVRYCGQLVRYNNNNNNNIFNCKWAVTQWQWLLCMYINMK